MKLTEWEIELALVPGSQYIKFKVMVAKAEIAIAKETNPVIGQPVNLFLDAEFQNMLEKGRRLLVKVCIVSVCELPV